MSARPYSMALRGAGDGSSSWGEGDGSLGLWNLCRRGIIPTWHDGEGQDQLPGAIGMFVVMVQGVEVEEAGMGGSRENGMRK